MSQRMNKDIEKVQHLLFLWMCHYDKINYDTIKRYCEYLNIQFNLQITEHPAWTLFLPLFYAGNVDYCGSKSFKVTEPMMISHKRRHLFINKQPSVDGCEKLRPAIYCSEGPQNCELKQYTFNGKEILKHFPSVDSIISAFELSPKNDFSDLTFDNAPDQIGIAYTASKRYYFVCENRKVVEIPNWSINPDSVNVAYQYSRVLGKKSNGNYDVEQRKLSVNSFRFPIMLYRVLMVASMLEGQCPYKESGNYIFPGISKSIVKELDRILCKSIHYE